MERVRSLPDTYSSSMLDLGAQRMVRVAARKFRLLDVAMRTGWRKVMKGVGEASLVDVGSAA